jgi:hypothetical protein
MDKTIKENIIVKLSNDVLFIELINLLKNNKNIILDNIINNKFSNIIINLKKIDFDINNIRNLSDDDLILINDLIKDKTNILTILLEIKKKKKEIYNHVNIISIIQQLILVVVIASYIYLIYDLYVVNYTKKNTDMYLNNLNILYKILFFTYIICFKNSIIALFNNLFKLPLIVYIIIFKIILIFILSKHEKIIKLFNNCGYIIIIAIIILILASTYYIHNNIDTYNYITNIDLSLYLYDKYGQHLDFDKYGQHFDYNLIDNEIKEKDIMNFIN